MGLKGIPTFISPDLLRLLAQMGHGDTLVLADAHFPAHSVGHKNDIPVIRLDAVTEIPILLAGILELVDLDKHTEFPAAVMDVTDGDKAKGMKTPLPSWQFYEKLCRRNLPSMKMEIVERFKFYEKAGKASVIVQTGDTSVYANLILTKGVIESLSAVVPLP